MIYLATPYTCSVKSVEHERFLKAQELTAILAREAVPCYSPIAFWHPIAERFSMPGDAEYWQVQDHDCLALCSELWIVMMEGWNRSRGITLEREAFQNIHGAGNVFLYTPYEVELACREYHDRRNSKRDAAVSDAMRSASASGGGGSPIGEGQELRKEPT